MRTIVLGLLAAAVVAAPAAAESTSSNWAGYAVMRDGVRFARVSGAWTMPRVDCSSAETRWSAVWVGLGGYTDNSPALEQIGTEADCDRSGRAHYSTWYELVPDVAHSARLRVHPGDRIAASVTVNGRRVRLRLSNRTTSRAFTRVLRADAIDLTSAEWIVEAPSACPGTSADEGCRIMPLADFGTTRITEARVVTTDGRSGTIDDDAWDVEQIHLRSHDDRFGPREPTAGATTGPLSPSGRAFTVRYSAVYPRTSPIAPDGR
jgi:hypothetical protein